MTLDNPFKRVLSGILATAMTLSMIPPPQVEASSGVGSTSNYFNAGSAPSTYTYKGTSNANPSYDMTDARYSIKVSLMWAPRAETWGTEPIAERYSTYDWDTDKVVYVIDGLYLYESSMPTYRNLDDVPEEMRFQPSYPVYWSGGSSLGYLTDIYPAGYRTVHKTVDDFTFQFLTKDHAEAWFINQSSTGWYDTASEWGVDGSVAQNHLAQDGQIPNVFYELEQWRSRIFNMNWDTSLVDANNQLNKPPEYGAFEDQSYLDGKADWIKENWGDYHNVTYSPGTYLTPELSGLVMPTQIFVDTGNPGETPYQGAKNNGYTITSDVEFGKSYYTSPYFINLLTTQMDEPSFNNGTSSYDREIFFNKDLGWKTPSFYNMLLGILPVATGEYDGDGNMIYDNYYGEYKIAIEPVSNRNFDYKQGAFTYKDMIMLNNSGVMSKNNPLGDGVDIASAQAYKQLANAFQTTDEDNGLGLQKYGALDNTNKYDVRNQYGLWVFTIPAVPVETNDPAPTIIKTYVEVDYFDESGKAVYKEVYPTTEATVLQTTGYGEHNDTTFYTVDGTLTQGHNIHAWEEISQLDEDGVETGVQLRAYLNDVLVVSPNVLSDPEQTVWVSTDLPQNFNVVGDTESTDFSTQLKATAENITSYHFDLLMGSTKDDTIHQEGISRGR